MPYSDENCTRDYKLGLALSGGGFRSALFHIGVLARLAELDLLRKIDVISSVSGGAIIAAYYYLKVKQLLERVPAEGGRPPGRDDYIRLVEEIETDFLAAVQKNMVIRTLIDPGKNARMRGSDYSNTERLAELLERHFYRPIFKTQDDNGDNTPISLRKINIRPHSGNTSAGTRNPLLIINATCLNTGHLWQFTNLSVGEQCMTKGLGRHPIGLLPKFRFEDERLTIEQRKILYNITLGQAVAASSCVSGIFEPLQIRYLYRMDKKPVNVLLADGGIVDNQGLESLFAENCTHIICSDGSNILKFEHEPSTNFFNAMIRTNDILMNRIRNESLEELSGYGPGRFAIFDLGNRETRENIFPADSEEIVEALTEIRTAMDAFSDKEAYTLMYYGYNLSKKILETNEFEPVMESRAGNGNWRFSDIYDHVLIHDKERRELISHLRIGSRHMFKVFMLKKTLPYLILVPVPAALAIWTLLFIMKTSPMMFWIIFTGFLFALIYSQNQRLIKIMDNIGWLRNLRQKILKVLISLRLPEPFSYIVSLASWIELAVFNPLFLHYGRIRKISENPIYQRPSPRKNESLYQADN